MGIFVRIYGDIRLLYLFIAALYLAYTYYWVFYKENEDIKKHLRNSILLFIFSVLSFIGSIFSLYTTFREHTTTGWELREVVSAELNQTKGLFVSWCTFLLGWGAYWFIMAWYMKFVWLRSGNVAMRTNSMNSVPATSPMPHSP